jgi:hypothetical protein
MSHAGVLVRLVAWMALTWALIFINSFGGAR